MTTPKLPPITLCLTAGGRPDLLEQTLASLLPLSGKYFSQTLFVNDFGDKKSNKVILRHLPDAKIFFHRKQKGHHRSVDELYQAVESELIFHCEDDWVFDPVDFMPDALAVLNADPQISQVCLRRADCYLSRGYDLNGPDFQSAQAGDVSYKKAVRPTRGGWGYFTFNPTLLRKELWREIGPFKNFYREYDINKRLCELGRPTAYLSPGTCRTIGQHRHMVDVTRKVSKTKLLRFRLRQAWQKLRPF